MGLPNSTARNILRRQTRALLVVIALSLSMVILISIPSGAAANQAATQNLTGNLGSTNIQTVASINQTLTEIDCSLAPNSQNLGFGNGSFTPGQFGGGNFNFTPGEFGGNFGNGNFTPGQFGGGPFGGNPFGGAETNVMNETQYSDISSLQNVAAVVPTLQVSEGQNQTLTVNGQSFTRLVPDYVIAGIPLNPSLVDNYPILPTNITAGRNLQADDSGVVLLSENNTKFFGAKVGDTVTILGKAFEVVGIHGSSGSSNTLTLYMSLSDAQALTNNTGYITSLKVFADSVSDVTEVVNAISSLHPELLILTTQQQSSPNPTPPSSVSPSEQPTTSPQTVNSVPWEIVYVIVIAVAIIAIIAVALLVRKRQKPGSDAKNSDNRSRAFG
jgi:putative ABC transport system permease protein